MQAYSEPSCPVSSVQCPGTRARPGISKRIATWPYISQYPHTSVRSATMLLVTKEATAAHIPGSDGAVLLGCRWWYDPFSNRPRPASLFTLDSCILFHGTWWQSSVFVTDTDNQIETVLKTRTQSLMHDRYQAQWTRRLGIYPLTVSPRGDDCGSKECTYKRLPCFQRVSR